jgi:hypothetical protein
LPAPFLADGAGDFKIDMYLEYIDDFTIQIILFIHWLILATTLMYFGSAFFGYVLRAIFGVRFKRKKDEM